MSPQEKKHIKFVIRDKEKRMKPETLIYDKVRKIIPLNSEKNIFFAGMTNSSHEVFFYSFFNGQPKQCYALAEEGVLDENELAAVFSELVEILRESKEYKEGFYNAATIIVDKAGIKLDMNYHDMEESEYIIQKEWKKLYDV